LCRSAAAATGESGQNAINFAILVLLIPTALIFAGVLFWAFRKQRAADNEDAAVTPSGHRLDAEFPAHSGWR
jgi:cbb3-type cytochrome oxidase subunit 3